MAEEIALKTSEEMETDIPKTVGSFLWFFIKRHKWQFAFIFFLCVLYASTRVFWPYASKLVIEAFEKYIAAGSPKGLLLDFIGGVILLYIGVWSFDVIVWRGQFMFRSYLHPALRNDIITASFAHIQKHSFNYHASHYAGNTVRRLINLGDCATELMTINYSIVSTTFTFLTTFILFLTVRWEFCLICFLWALLHLSFCMIRSRKWNALANESAGAKGVLVGKIMDSVINFSNVKIFAKEKQERKFLSPYFKIMKDKSKESEVVITKDQMFLGFACIILLLLPAFHFIVKFYTDGKISVGDIIFILGAVKMLIDRVYELGEQIGKFSQQYGILKQSLSIISAPLEVVDKAGAKPIEIKDAEIAFHNVTFGYPGKKRHLLFENLSLTIKPGERLGIVGESGSGKSSMLNLLLRFFDVDGGMIRIDGQDIKEVTQKSLRENIAFIPQDTTLFHRTIEENIRFGKEDVKEEEIVKAAKRGGAHEFIKALPEGYKTEVGERGVKISTGQRQRLSITRALLKDAPILILDEATSSLDSETELSIQKSLQELMKNRTTIAIAHRLSTLRHMDRIIVLDKGKIAEEGAHKTLLAKKGIYAKLWSMQSDGFIAKAEDAEEEIPPPVRPQESEK